MNVEIEELETVDAGSFKTALREDGAFAVTGQMETLTEYTSVLRTRALFYRIRI